MLDNLREQCFKNENKVAYVINDSHITYKELWYKANSLASYLSSQGADPVIIYGHKSINMYISIFACLLAKRTYVPIDLHIPLERINKIITYTKASLLIKNEPIPVDNIDTVELTNFNYDINSYSCQNSNDTAYIMFTSGSTGEPKGVPISRGNLDNFIKWISNLEVLSKMNNAVVLNQASFSFDLSVADIFYSIFNGHTLIGLDKKAQDNYNDVFEIILKHKVSIAVMTPTFAKMLLLNNDFSYQQFPFLKCLYFCGEILEVITVRKLYQRFPDLVVINAYGPTEATCAVSAIKITKEMLNDEILPVGDMNNNATSVEVIGDEIVLKGKSVFNGYLNNEKGGYFKEDGINAYHTGDIGYIRDNKLYCKGRLDNQIKYKGYRIELGDIENNFKKIKGVSDAIVIVKHKEDNKTVKLLKAFVVLEETLNEEYLRQELAKRIPIYMIPKVIIIVDKLPVNKNGKYDRKLLSSL